jgi:UDP-glucose:O-linked fucose beta-1,3-glucosyltransferase
MAVIGSLLLLWASLVAVARGSTADLFFLVRSQPTALDRSLSKQLVTDLVRQGVPRASIRCMHDEAFPDDYWPIISWMEPTLARAPAAARWFVFCEPSTRVRVRELGELLSQHNSAAGTAPADRQFIGMRLRDSVGSVARGFDTATQYPFLHAGFALNRPLLAAMVASIRGDPLPNDLSIDTAYELARAIKRRAGVELTGAPQFCTGARADASVAVTCATYVASVRHARDALPRFPLEPTDVVIAIKTTKLFHATRVKLLLETWAGPDCPVPVFVTSDAVDPAVQSVDMGVNTKKGHCAKAMAILHWLAKEHPGKKWYFIADDDTVLGVDRLLRLLRTYDSSQPLFIGERYGLGRTGANWKKDFGTGNDFITMGGGVVYSGPALRALVACRDCHCMRPDEPDDMALGFLMSNRVDPPVRVTHEEGFHQARPREYHPLVLRHQDSMVSFHRFDVNDAAALHREYDRFLGDHVKHEL